MTDKEKAIVTAYTGIAMLAGDKFDIFHRYIEEKMGRPIWTHELASKEVWEEIKEATREDFIGLCLETSPEAIPIEWIEDYLQKYTDMAGEYMGKDNDIAMYGIIRLNIISELLSAWKHKDNPHEYFPYVKGEGWKKVIENCEEENE